MNEPTELLVKFIDALSEPNPTPEQKVLRALIKTALLSDNIISFINEVSTAFQGFGKVNSETVKGTVRYFKAYNEVQIRKLDCTEEEKDALVKQEENRLTEIEVWILGSLAHLGLLK